MVLGWLLILGLVIVLSVIISIFVHLQHEGKKIKLIILAIILLFLVFSFIYVSSVNQLDLKSKQGIFNAGKIYFSGIGKTMYNIVKATGQAVKDISSSFSNSK
jgi:hypothetical protein